MAVNAVKKSNSLQFVLQVRRVTSNAVKKILVEHMSSRCIDGISGVKMSLQGDSLFERGIGENLGRTNSPTSVRHGNGLGFIRI